MSPIISWQLQNHFLKSKALLPSDAQCTQSSTDAFHYRTSGFSLLLCTMLAPSQTNADFQVLQKLRQYKFNILNHAIFMTVGP